MRRDARLGSKLLTVLFPTALLVLVGCQNTGTGGAKERASDSGRSPSLTLTGDPATSLVRYRDREVDLAPFLVGYPYSRFSPDLEHGHLLYFESTPEGQFLRYQELGTGSPDPAAGRRLTDIDWSTRSYWGARYHAASDRFFLTSDESNDEKMNVYALSRRDGSLEQITHHDYTYGWGFSEDERFLAVLDRSGMTEPFHTTLKIHDLETGEVRTVLSDEGRDVRFTWTEPRFDFDNSALFLEVLHDGNRNTPNLARIDLTSPNPDFDLLLPPRVVRYGVSMMKGWVDDHTLLFQSGESGTQDIYRLNLADDSVTRITDFKENVASAALMKVGERPVILALLGGHVTTEFRLVDPTSGDSLAQSSLPSNCWISDHHGPDAIFQSADTTTPFRLGRVSVVPGPSEGSLTFQFDSWLELPSEHQKQICTLRSELVEFPTFDRTLQGFYLEPINPPKDPAERRVMIIAFYGGDNSYSRDAHILGAAGIATFSPRVRGAWGNGEEFAALNDGDLGGDEIVDLFYAARWLVEHKGYEPHQIGVRGGSHGGYATLRAMTFPPETNDRNDSFDFGFGWSHAGFSDIISFHDECNIPDWVTKEAGDPVRERDKLIDRSPLTHVDRLRAPILLTHGANDWRVPVDESRRFVERAKDLGRPVEYLEFEGQGHGIQGFDNQVRYYQGVMQFLETIQDPLEEEPIE